MASSVSSYRKRLIESLSLLPLQLKILAFDAWEYLKVVFNYYNILPFAKADISLVLKGLVENPFKVARFYGEKGGITRGELSSYTYGETPLTTFAEIAKETGIGPSATLIECGAGRGRVALFAHLVLGCKVIVYEKVPEFVKRLKRYVSPGFEVFDQDYFTADVKRGDVIFLYGTTLTEGEIKRFGKLLESAKEGTMLVTVSWYLNETDGTPHFPILKVMEGKFPWGTTNIYIQTKKISC